MEGSSTTKTRILLISIRMFAETGYDLVSMRDIASELGIRASSIYNHYPNKAAILKSVVDMFREELRARRMNEWREDIEDDLRSRGSVQVITDMMTAPLKLLEDPFLQDMIRIMTRAQFHDNEVRKFLYDELIMKPHGFLKILVARAGITEGSPYDAEFIAAELQSPMTSYFYQLSLAQGGRTLDAAAIRNAVERHVNFVLMKIRCNPEEER